MQDVYLGVFMAMLPMLGAIEEINVADVLVLVSWLVLSFAFLAVLTGVLTKVSGPAGLGSVRAHAPLSDPTSPYARPWRQFVVERILYNIKMLDVTTQLLALLAICFAMLKVTEHMQVREPVKGRTKRTRDTRCCILRRPTGRSRPLSRPLLSAGLHGAGLLSRRAHVQHGR